MHTTNYENTFIRVSEDCPVAVGKVPPKPDSVAGRQLALLHERPYGLTSDDLIFAVHASRKDVAEADLDAARAAFFARPLACLRASPLVKTYGWALHNDAEGRVAAVSAGTPAYEEFVADERVKILPGMRSARAR